MDITIDTNINKFADRFGNFPDKIKEAIRKATTISALLIERGSKMRAPVDTGRLRASIATSLHPLSATISTHVFYAQYVHEGTRYMPARPFMRDTAEQEKEKINSVFKEEISSALNAG